MRDAARTLAVALRMAPEGLGGLIRATKAGHVELGEQYVELQSFGRRALSALGVELEVVGADRVPGEGGLVFMWNQTTHLDHLLLPAALPRPALSIYNNAVARTPFYGRYMAAVGHFHVDRHDEAQWRQSLARAAEAVKAGACLIVSPEGTRSWDGRLLAMKRGAFLMARAASRPIVCVTVSGGVARLPRGAAAVRPGPLRVRFGDPIPVPPDGGPPGLLERRVVETFEADMLD